MKIYIFSKPSKKKLERFKTEFNQSQTNSNTGVYIAAEHQESRTIVDGTNVDMVIMELREPLDRTLSNDEILACGMILGSLENKIF